MTNQIEFSPERIHSLGRSQTRLAELLLLLLLGNENTRIEFSNRDRFVFPVGNENTFPPFPARYAGRNINHFKRLFGITHPRKKGTLTCTLNGKNAELSLEIFSEGKSIFAKMVVEKSTIDPDDCQCVLKRYFELRQKEQTLTERFRRWIRRRFGKNIYQRYGVPKPDAG
jgi:hypothetical protein